LDGAQEVVSQASKQRYGMKEKPWSLSSYFGMVGVGMAA
jgi:hypothetical protein